MKKRGWFDTLASLFLIESVPAFLRSLAQRIVKKPKTLVIDSGLCCCLNGLQLKDLESVLGINHLGPLLEGFVAAELLRQRTWSDTDYEVFHYREPKGAEVDLILELPGRKVIAIEVKASTSIGKKHFSGLDKLRDKLGDDFHMGIVLHLGQRAWSHGDRLLSMPVSALWEL